MTTVLTTHHHHDHAGGNLRLLQLMGVKEGEIKVVGGDQSLQALNHLVADKERLQVMNYSLNNVTIFVILFLKKHSRLVEST